MARLYYCPDCDGAGSHEVGERMGNGRCYTGNDPYWLTDIECSACDGDGRIELSRTEGERRGLRPYTPSRRRWALSLHHKGRPYTPASDPLIALAKARTDGIGYRSAAYARAREWALGVRA